MHTYSRFSNDPRTNPRQVLLSSLTDGTVVRVFGQGKGSDPRQLDDPFALRGHFFYF